MTYRIGLAGNPNSGKTTLFNALTGSQQKVGNWPGVTVERKSGHYIFQKHHIEVIDLPGTYSLVAHCEQSSLDERIACEFIFSGQADVIVNVLDAANLERNLYLTMQLIEMRVPMVVVLNRMDIVQKRGFEIHAATLAQVLGCPVVPIIAHQGVNIDLLNQAVVSVCQKQALPAELALPHAELQTAVAAISETVRDYHASPECLALRLLEGDCFSHKNLPSSVLDFVKQEQARITQVCGDDADILIAENRYQFIHDLVSHVFRKQSEQKTRFSQRLDAIVLNRFLGIPIFLLVMYSLFLFAMNIGGAFQDFFDISSETIFVSGFAHLLQSLHAPTWLIAILASGAGKGLNTTVTFIPIIGSMFFFLSLLEASGYMARAAFVVDRFMRAMGLPGKSFVPMIVGFGCNVPAIMAARTLENPRDRILTIIMSPFMSCGARLAIFAVFTAAFFPSAGHNVVFALYMTGILVAIVTGFVLRKTLLQGQPSPFILELPDYQIPSWRDLTGQTWLRLKRFLTRATRVIIPVCIIIGALNAVTLDMHLSMETASQHSILSMLGMWMTPLFHPMGITADNWPATVGLLTGTLAKEVVVATLNTLYSQVGHLGAQAGEQFQLWAGLKAALLSVPHNLAALPSVLANPIAATAPDSAMDPGVYGVMYQRFHHSAAAFSYLLFVLLYVPCVTTMAAMSRELNRGWTVFSVAWSFFVAYAVAVGFYQVATFRLHPSQSLLWLFGLSCAFFGVVLILRLIASPPGRQARFVGAH